MQISVSDGATSPTVTRSMHVDELFDSWSSTGETLNVTAATTLNSLPPVPTTPVDAVDGVTNRARGSEWTDRDMAARRAAVREFKRLVIEHRHDLMTLLQIETGKSRDDAQEELLGAVNAASFYAEKAPEYLAADHHDQPFPTMRTRTSYEPYGVVGVILPWNYPVALAAYDVLPALLAGNSVVVKPSERAPYSTLYFLSLLLEAGVPSDAVHAVIGKGNVGAAVVETTDMVAFTGSTVVGKKVAEQAATSLTPVSLELGGNNPLLVLDGVNPKKAARGAVEAAFTNTGQFCMATERVFVHDAVYDEFIEALDGQLESLSFGVSYEYKTDFGVLVDQAHREHVAEHIEQTVEAGATLHAGGRALDGTPTGYEPTVLTNVPSDAVGMKEETFGPVMYIQRIQSDEEMIQRANDTPYGLHASVWGPSDKAEEVATKLNVGSVAVNDAFISVFSATGAPTGGWGDSGLGRRNGVEGIRRYTQSRTISVNDGPLPTRPKWFPPTLYDNIIAGIYKYVPLYD